MLTEEGYQRAKLYNDLVKESKEKYSMIKQSSKDQKKKKKIKS